MVRVLEPTPAPCVLVVDDDDQLRHSVVRQLACLKASVEDFASPRAALHWIDQGGVFDAALFDVNMPELPGDRLAAELLVRRPAARIVLVTGGRREDVDAPPGVRVLQKPVEMEELRSLVAEWRDAR